MKGMCGMRVLTVYSSVTGNTRRVAEAIAAETPGQGLCPVDEAPEPADYDVLLLGFWVRRGQPDPRMLRYMERVYGKELVLFGTLGAWPDSDHALRCAAAAADMMHGRGNSVRGVFLCQGRVNPKILEKASDSLRQKHPPTEERRLRHLEAAKHPDARDLANAKSFVRRCLEEIAHCKESCLPS